MNLEPEETRPAAAPAVVLVTILLKALMTVLMLRIDPKVNSRDSQLSMLRTRQRSLKMTQHLTVCPPTMTPHSQIEGKVRMLSLLNQNTSCTRRPLGRTLVELLKLVAVVVLVEQLLTELRDNSARSTTKTGPRDKSMHLNTLKRLDETNW